MGPCETRIRDHEMKPRRRLNESPLPTTIIAFPSWNFPEIDTFLGLWDAGIDRNVEFAKLTSR